MQRIRRPSRLLLLIPLLIATPLVYSLVHGWWYGLFVSWLWSFQPSSFLMSFVRELAVVASGAGLIAILLAAPLAVIVRMRPILGALLLLASAAVTLFPDVWMAISFPAFSKRVIFVQLPPLLLFFAFSWIVIGTLNARFRKPVV